jgi:methanogenic corrinoid protein MtbC1
MIAEQQTVASPQFDRYLNALLGGQRAEAKGVMAQAIQLSPRVTDVYDPLLWRTIEELNHRLRTEAIAHATHDLAVRIHRQVCDQVAAQLPTAASTGKRAILACGAGEPEELAGQLVADRLEAAGWEVYFLGSQVPPDEILQLVGRVRPQALVIFASRPAELPSVRRLIDMVHAVDACPDMNVIVGGGVFNRAEGLAEEIGADLSASTIRGVLDVANSALPRPASSALARKRRWRTIGLPPPIRKAG